MKFMFIPGCRLSPENMTLDIRVLVLLAIILLPGCEKSALDLCYFMHQPEMT